MSRRVRDTGVQGDHRDASGACLQQAGGQDGALYPETSWRTVVVRCNEVSEETVINSRISVPRDALAAFCQEHGIKRLSVFGSVLREDFGPESDIDVLVEFEPGRTPGLLGIAGIEMRLSALFGREVDLVTRSAVEQSRNYIRRSTILDWAEEVYAT